MSEGALEDLKEMLLQAIEAHREMTDVQFQAVEERFDSLERLRLEQKADTKVHVDSSLQAQKDAAVKAEAATTKQLDAQTTAFTTAIEGVNNSIADIKDRVSKIEAMRAGEVNQVGDTRAGISVAILAAGVVLSGVALIASVLIALLK